MNNQRWEIALGGFAVVFALLTVLAWIPASVESGLIEQVRRQVIIGDALMPTVCAVLIGGIGLMLLTRRAPHTEGADKTAGLSAANLRFASVLAGVIGLGLALMVNLGPWSVELAQALGADLPAYRDLRDTAPWKYIGYLAGGFVIVMGLVSFIQGRIAVRSALVALVSVLVMAMIIDLPFEHLLLPPNGDQ
ncbi:hypothetical protein [Marinobacterium rhizophilum]|uniref:Tripartite tricarboxylate transporter TctB family protein n=1 Tax=Marinobacterium rhizophilum TaxID=420402 RepID=A0ABY5HNG1_9GAMM|nr:hypothetical protein [Marinobacterium rhizophilum]UTW13113.1 hypothetical protein KDW95_05480 [Marinobacterium rhizophilum]